MLTHSYPPETFNLIGKAKLVPMKPSLEATLSNPFLTEEDMNSSWL
jgi:hypothetical protein